MLSSIRVYFYGALAALFAGLIACIKVLSMQKDKYKAESELNKSKSDSADKRIEAHELREEIEQSNANIDSDDIDAKLHDYYRD